MKTRATRRSFLLASANSVLLLGAGSAETVQLIKTPNGGLQPQAVVDSKGVIHLVYLYGAPAAADIGYVSKGPADERFSEPIRVNDHPGSAIAIGTVRGAHLAVGRSDRIHVAWNGSAAAEPKGPQKSAPMLYTRLNDKRDGFEPQRSVMTIASGLDGGGAVAADAKGNVCVTWHARGQENGQPIEGEGHRRVWMAQSRDDGRTFGLEAAISPAEQGACGCCGMGAITDEKGRIYLLYRSAREIVHRDMYLLTSSDGGKTFQAIDLHPWQIGACPMSTVSLAAASGRVLISWETAGQVFFSVIDSRNMMVGKPVSAPGEGGHRKHPSVATNRAGQTLLVWTEGTGWKRGGSLAWQRFDEGGQSIGTQGRVEGLPAWDFAAATCQGNNFLVIS
jgi:hypothetical protein